MTPPQWLVLSFPVTTGPRLRTGPHTISTQGDPPRTSKADHPSQAHHLSEQVSAEVITLITFTAPQLMDRAYIDWLETLPCNRKPQKVNQWMGDWAAIA